MTQALRKPPKAKLKAKEAFRKGGAGAGRHFLDMGCKIEGFLLYALLLHPVHKLQHILRIGSW